MNVETRARLSAFRIALPALAALCAFGWAPTAAAGPACLLNDDSKVCLDLSSTPPGTEDVADSTVQPSEAGGTPTYIKYHAVLTNATMKSTRFVRLTMTLTQSTAVPAGEEGARFVSLEYPEARARCSFSATQAVCDFDKVTAGEPMAVEATAQTPSYETTLVDTAVFGWQGRTSTTLTSIPVRSDSGATWVPPGESVTIVTAPQNPDPSQQTTPEDPLWAAIELPARPFGYPARVLVIQDGPAMQCTGAGDTQFFGPFLCRDTGAPQRWVYTDLPDDLFTAADPMRATIIWDDSIVQDLQQPPAGGVGTGVPPFAIFHNQTTVAVPYGETRAFATPCAATASAAPCIETVAEFGNTGDWIATFRKANDGSDMDDPLAPLAELLDWLIRVAEAGPVTIGPVMK